MDTFTVKEAAKLIKKPEQFVRIGLRDKRFDWGDAVFMGKSWSYVIYKKKLLEFVGEEKE